MVKIPTVLILGAGASMDYGFPSGYDLLKSIHVRCREATKNDLTEHAALVGINCDELQQLGKMLESAPFLSIDAFLESRPEYLKAGKFAIAHGLIAYERENNLWDIDRRGGSWYQRLFDAIRTPTFEEVSGNQLSIITYNYDRSLEHFLHHAIMVAYNKFEAQATEALKAIPIIHLHGMLGDYPAGRKYESRLSAGSIERAMRGIKVIGEKFDLDHDPSFTQAYRLLDSALRVVFLGFGYHPENVNRLRITDRAQRMLVGTAPDMGMAELAKVHNMLPRIQLVPDKIFGLLRYIDVLS